VTMKDVLAVLEKVAVDLVGFAPVLAAAGRTDLETWANADRDLLVRLTQVLAQGKLSPDRLPAGAFLSNPPVVPVTAQCRVPTQENPWP
jgi:hypothetical protein